MKAQNPKNVVFRFWVIASLALAGFTLSVALTQHFYEIRNGTAPFQSFCNVGEAVNCDVIAASRFAQLIPGLPVSSLGAGWFLVLLLLALIGVTQVFWRKEVVRAAAVWTLLGLIVALVYLAIMVGAIGTLCLMCLGIDAIIFASFILSLSLRPESLQVRPLDRARWKTFGTLAGVALIGSALVLKLMDTQDIDAETRTQWVQAVLGNPVLPIQPAPANLRIGPADAPITIVEFSDFQCPFCKRGALILNSLLQRYPTQLKVEFRNFPLNAACNPSMKGSMHPAACEAASTAFCAAQSGRFKAVYESLFENQERLRPGVPAALAVENGVDRAALEACASGDEARSSIRRDVEEGDRLGVKSTPTFFINGHKVEGAFPVSVWVQLIEALLRESSNQ